MKKANKNECGETDCDDSGPKNQKGNDPGPKSQKGKQISSSKKNPTKAPKPPEEITKPDLSTDLKPKTARKRRSGVPIEELEEGIENDEIDIVISGEKNVQTGKISGEKNVQTGKNKRKPPIPQPKKANMTKKTQKTSKKKDIQQISLLNEDNDSNDDDDNDGNDDDENGGDNDNKNSNKKSLLIQRQQQQTSIHPPRSLSTRSPLRQFEVVDMSLSQNSQNSQNGQENDQKNFQNPILTSANNTITNENNDISHDNISSDQNNPKKPLKNFKFLFPDSSAMNPNSSAMNSNPMNPNLMNPNPMHTVVTTTGTTTTITASVTDLNTRSSSVETMVDNIGPIETPRRRKTNSTITTPPISTTSTVPTISAITPSKPVLIPSSTIPLSSSATQSYIQSPSIKKSNKSPSSPQILKSPTSSTSKIFKSPSSSSTSKTSKSPSSSSTSKISKLPHLDPFLPEGVLPVKPLKSQSCLYLFNSAKDVKELQSPYVYYNTTDKIPKPLAIPRLIPLGDGDGDNEEKNQQKVNNKMNNNDKNDKNNKNDKNLKKSTQSQKYLAPIPDYDLFMSMDELCTTFLILTGQLSLDTDDVYLYIDEMYKEIEQTNDPKNQKNQKNYEIKKNYENQKNYENFTNENVETTNEKNNSKNTDQKKKTTLDAQSQRLIDPPFIIPSPDDIIGLDSLELRGNAGNDFFSLYSQLVQIPPSQLYIDPALLLQLIQGKSGKYQFSPSQQTLKISQTFMEKSLSKSDENEKEKNEKEKNEKEENKIHNKEKKKVQNNEKMAMNQNDIVNTDNDDNNPPPPPHILTPIGHLRTTHPPIPGGVSINPSNLVKQGDKYGDYDGLCGFVDFLNFTRTAGLWIDLNYELYE